MTAALALGAFGHTPSGNLERARLSGPAKYPESELGACGARQFRTGARRRVKTAALALPVVMTAALTSEPTGAHYLECARLSGPAKDPEGELGACGARQILSDTRMRDVKTSALTLDLSQDGGSDFGPSGTSLRASRAADTSCRCLERSPWDRRSPSIPKHGERGTALVTVTPTS